jgi:hypothetical protein
MERMQREFQERRQAGPRPPEDAEIGEAVQRLTREIEVLQLRLQIAQSELQLLHAKARLRALTPGENLSSEDGPRSDAERMPRGLRGRFFPEDGPEGRMQRGPRDRPEGRSDERGRLRPDQREAPREERRERPGDDGLEPRGIQTPQDGGEERRERRDEDETLEGVLNQPLVIPFPDPTSFEEVVKYLKRSTVGDTLPNGVAIYIDPRGLHKAGQSMESKVHLKAEDVPLKESLNQLLSQIGLKFDVKDGLILITSKEPPAEAEDDASKDDDAPKDDDDGDDDDDDDDDDDSSE